MNNPSFQESHISQVPTVGLLQQLGHAYLSPEEVYAERRTKLCYVLMESILAKQLKRLNAITFKGQSVPFSDENITKAIEALREVPFDGLVRTSERVYDLLTLGKSLDQTIDGVTKGGTLRFTGFTIGVEAHYEHLEAMSDGISLFRKWAELT